MKKIWFLLVFAFFFAACVIKSKDNNTSETTDGVISNGMITYRLKIDGLQDSAIADSIWRIIFQVGGIDKLVISREDSMAVFTVDPDSVSNELLRREVVKRGGRILN